MIVVCWLATPAAAELAVPVPVPVPPSPSAAKLIDNVKIDTVSTKDIKFRIILRNVHLKNIDRYN